MTRAFIDRLTAPRAAALRRRGLARVDYLDASPLGALAAAALGLDARRLEFRMMDVRDTAGISIRFRIPHADLDEAIDAIRSLPAFKRWAAGAKDRLPFYLARAAATSSATDHNRLWRELYLIQVFAWTMRREGLAEADAFLDTSPWTPILARRAQQEGIRLSALGRAPLLRSLREAAVRWAGRGAFGTLLRWVRAHGLRGAAAFLRPPPAAAAPGPRLAAEYIGQLNLDRPELQSDLFFWQASPLRKRGALLLFQAVSDPLRGAHLEELRAHGLDGLAVAPAAAADPSLPVFSPRSAAVEPARERPPADALERWLARAARDYRDQRAFWRELFERHGVRLFAGWYTHDPAHAAMADALRDLGGVHAVYQRSYEGLPSWTTTAATDVQFAWGRHTAGAPAPDGAGPAYTVATGFLGDHRFAALKPQARELRARLEKAGARRVIALFDENSLGDHRWHVGHDRLKLAYRFILEKVLSDDRLGLIVKPKIARTLRSRLAPLDSLLAEAERTGRCFVFEGGAIHSSHPPAAAALAADVAVHAYLVAGSAAAEAALAGVPTLLLDHDGFAISPLYKLGLGRVVFKEWDPLWRALQEHWSRPDGVPGFGDWSELLPDLDPFRDGRAAERMGGFLDKTLAALEGGATREEAMARAADAYAREWGAAHVWEGPGARSKAEAGSAERE